MHLEEAAEPLLVLTATAARQAAVVSMLRALAATPVGASPGPVPHSLVATGRRLAVGPLRDSQDSAGRAQEGAQEAPAPMMSRLQVWPRRRCRIANQALRAHVPADKSAVVRWWP